jgi:hypothetical protein
MWLWRRGAKLESPPQLAAASISSRRGARVRAGELQGAATSSEGARPGALACSHASFNRAL